MAENRTSTNHSVTKEPSIRPRLIREPKGPSNFTSICLGYDEPSWLTSYVETTRGVNKNAYRVVRDRVVIPPNQIMLSDCPINDEITYNTLCTLHKDNLLYSPNIKLFHKSGDKCMKSTFQDSYEGFKPETTATIYEGRMEELRKNKELHTKDSALLNETEAINDDIHLRPKSTMKDHYMDRQVAQRDWVAIQEPRKSTLPLPSNLWDDENLPQEGMTETAHQFQWPRNHPSEVLNVLYQYKAYDKIPYYKLFTTPK